MKKLIFIAGSEHCGSTLMEIMLSGHKDVLGLGETWQLIDKKRWSSWVKENTNPCSCGVMIHDCPLWGGVLDYVKKHNEEDGQGMAYDYLLDKIEEMNTASIIIDSSKNIVALDFLRRKADQREINIIVLHVIKDIRSWLGSIEKVHGVTGIIDLYRRMSEWKANNSNIYSYAMNHNLQYIRVGYEELCFHTKFIFKKLSELIEIPFDDNICKPAEGRGHIGAGNPMRHDKIKASDILYDNRWYFSQKINFLYLIRPSIANFNREFVYSNTFDMSLLNERSFTPKND